MGNIIGIKLADGSFYPVMEEGKPFCKKLELTTVKDNQTTVHLDLYRSATGTMEDAEYVDTLMIENLIPHPKQENTLNLKINLDENNMLSAEIDDPETGTSSNSKVSLVNLQRENLNFEPDYELSKENFQEDSFEIPSETENNLIEDFNIDEDFASFEESVLEEPKLEEPLMEEISLSEENPLPEEIDIPVNEEIVAREDSKEENLENTAFALGAVAAGALGGTILAETLDKSDTTEDDFVLPPEEDVIDEDFSFPDETNSIIEDISGDSEPTFLGNIEEAFQEDINISIPEDNFDIQDSATLDESFSITDDNLENFDFTESDLPSFDDFDMSVPETNSLETDDEAPFSFDSLPDFDDIPELQDNYSESLEIGDFELPDFGDTPDINTNNFASSSPNSVLFDGLYDDDFQEPKESHKRTTISTVICIICALICMGVLAAILWLTKPNFFNKNKEAPIVEEIVETPVPEIVEEEIIEPEEDLTSAKEDFIVITPEPVVPEIPEPKEEAVPEDIIYRIKWGDTLWDLADSYYQNPWLYKKIAKANNIKNPDVIISGTDIVIPPLN